MTDPSGRDGASEIAQEDYELLAAFRHLLRGFLAFSEAAAQQAGLTAQHHQALLAIKGRPGGGATTVGELAERLGIRHHSAVGLVDRLATRGLAERRPAAEDRRRVLVALTPKAEALLASLSAAHREELRRLAPMLRGLLQRIEG